MPKTVCLIICFFFGAFAMAQLPAKQYTFTHYTTAGGLASNQVNTVLQDEEGYIWLATGDGLQRFDGVRYKTFRHDAQDPSSLPVNFVGQMLFDNNKNLWMMLGGGRVCFLNTKTFVFTEVNIKLKKNHPNNATSRLLTKDEYGHLFLQVAGSEIVTYSAKTNEFSYENNFVQQKEEWNIYAFIPQLGTHKYWMSIAGAGIAIYNQATGNLSYAGHNIEHESIIEQTKDLINSVGFYFDRKGRCWFINWNPNVPSVFCFDPNSNSFLCKGLRVIDYLKTYHEIVAFSEQQDGSIWIRGIPVLAKYIPEKNAFQMIENGYINEQGISYASITCITEDREKNLWVSTDNNGLFRCNPSTEIFTNVNRTNPTTLKKNIGDPMSFIRTKQGTILVGTWGDGMYEYDSNFNEIPFFLKYKDNVNPFAWSMILAKDSSIWISSQPGLYNINQDKKTYTYFNPPLLNNKTIRQVAEDKHGNLWLGMHSTGVFKWTAAKGKNNFNDGISKFSSIPDGMVPKITIDSYGLVWIAAGMNGVYVIDPDTDKIVVHFGANETNEKKLPEPSVTYTGEYDSNTMLIATSFYVIVYNRKSNTSEIIVSPENIAGYISSFLLDKNSYLWLGTSNGLYRINIQKKIFTRFNRESGIENEKFDPAAAYTLPDGRMLFGTTNNFIYFDPAKVKVNNIFSDVSITDFKISGKPYRIDSLLQLKEIELGTEENALEIAFSSLLYNSTSLIQYKLEGIDKDWVTADKNYHAIYNYLPPGSYSFLLKTMNEDGKESTKIKQLHIKIDAPFWKSTWFISLLILFLVVGLFGLDRLRMKRKEAIQKMRSELADNLHQEVNMALSNINILSEMGKLKADKDPEKSKEFIEQIHSKSQNMMIAMDDMLWTINPENDSMSKVIDRMKEHIDALRNHYEVTIYLQLDKKVEELKVNMKLRQNIFWFFKSGSTNIIKTGASDCYIHIGLEKTNLIYTFEFDSSKSDLQQLNNLLLRQELALKIKEANAIIDFKLKDTRSKIELIIPV